MKIDKQDVIVSVLERVLDANTSIRSMQHIACLVATISRSAYESVSG
jgi:hypothetical protein